MKSGNYNQDKYQLQKQFIFLPVFMRFIMKTLLLFMAVLLYAVTITTASTPDSCLKMLWANDYNVSNNTGFYILTLLISI